MTHFVSPRDEFLETQNAAEELLRRIAASGASASDREILRLEKLADACARLCYSNNLNSELTESIHNLIAWCDHLDDLAWRERFCEALNEMPLRSPWE